MNTIILIVTLAAVASGCDCASCQSEPSRSSMPFTATKSEMLADFDEPSFSVDSTASPDFDSRLTSPDLNAHTDAPVATAEPSNDQRVCPVTGDELGSLGPPIPVTVRGKTVWVCCEGCVRAVQRNPDKYLPAIEEEPSESAAAGLNPVESLFAGTAPRWGGQKRCPVTGEELGSMGPPISVTVRGKTIWVCCKACVAAVQRNPDKYLNQGMPHQGSREQ
jgi:YHS domain-containing protein